MFGGGVLASFVLTPIFAMFVRPEKPLDPTDSVSLLATTQALWGQIRNDYVIYIGAGAVATGGLISLVQSLPIIGQGIVGSLRSMGKGSGRSGRDSGRTGATCRSGSWSSA